MKIDPQFLSLLEAMVIKQRGVFTLADLKNLFLASSTVSLNQRLKPFLAHGILRRFCRGFYVARSFDLAWLSQRIYPESAVSLSSVLSQEMLIGVIPAKTVYAVKVGKSRIYRSEFAQVVHLGFASAAAADEIWFGYDIVKDGVRYADREKAFLDTLYFYQSGHKFSFNIYSDIHVDRLNQRRLTRYLARYRNPKFKAFVKGVLDGYRSVR